MAEKELAIKRLQQRHDTAQNWKVKNPILAEGEIGVETDTGNIKAGNGTATWNSLPYSNARLGVDGISATHSWNGTVLTITSASGSSSADLRGPEGPAGPKGPKGDKGDTGEVDTSNFYTKSEIDNTATTIQNQINNKLATSEVGNSAGKIPRYSSDGHLVLPSGIELW